ncbi:hypothetical protein [Mycobacterium sp. IS-3022]|uniref:hypothetical protein n=1 Tax=Mycobacterium sp. IS-3022 TaxID=1772277 RepID=UPI000741561D|nr:hypothetical protein [Mycobacterium sp. IS-3022]KUI04456.1 hypothetical protein AU188_03950 [Mycobacterium sp. IS-3022]
MTDKCISGRHNYEHPGTSCDDMDEHLRVMREVALGKTSIVSHVGPSSVWDENGDPVPDAVIPDGIDSSGAGVYASGAIGTAHGDDDEDA